MSQGSQSSGSLGLSLTGFHHPAFSGNSKWEILCLRDECCPCFYESQSYENFYLSCAKIIVAQKQSKLSMRRTGSHKLCTMDHTEHLEGVLYQHRVLLKQLSSQTQPVATFNIRPSREWTVLGLWQKPNSVQPQSHSASLSHSVSRNVQSHQLCHVYTMNLDLTFPIFCASARGEGKNQSASILGLEAILQKRQNEVHSCL